MNLADTYTVAFQIKAESQTLKKEFKKNLYSFVAIDGFNYVLMSADKKIREKELIAFAIYDIKENQYKNGIIRHKKEYIIFSSQDGVIFDISYIPATEVEKEGIENFCENYFNGYPYRICYSFTELKRMYQKRENIFFRVFIIISLFASIAFVLYQTLHIEEVEFSQPPKPTLAIVTDNEKNEIKHKMGLLIINHLLDKIEYISKTQKPIEASDVTRISMISIENGAELPAEEPFYDESLNQWVYANPQQKRGGYTTTLLMNIEKKYAENDFREKSKGIYLKEDINATTLYYNKDFSDAKKITEISVGCISDMLLLSTIEAREKGNITFRLAPPKSTFTTLTVLLTLQDIFTRCPIYFNDLILSDTERTATLHLYYTFEDK